MNLIDDRVEVQRTPVRGTWTERTVFQRGAVVSPVAFPDLSFSVDDLLGWRRAEATRAP